MKALQGFFICLILIISINLTVKAQNLEKRLNSLPCYSRTEISDKDWLLNPAGYTAQVYQDNAGKELVLSNGIIERRFSMSPAFACFSLKNLVSGEEMLRAAKPEGTLTIDGKEIPVGGIDGQFEYGYIQKDWLPGFKNDQKGFQLYDFSVSMIKARFDWKPVRWIPDTEWPPKGKELIFYFRSVEFTGMSVEVHYELYDGIPLISKWMIVKNTTGKPCTLNHFVNEYLAVVEPAAAVETLGTWDFANMLVCSDYAFGGMNTKSSNHAAQWLKDSLYTSQVDYGMNTPCLLKCSVPYGPEQELNAGETFESTRVYELLFDNDDHERKGLAVRKMYRKLAPWALENPIFLHLTSTDPEVMKTAIDQCVNTGFEMIILSFGSGLNMENSDTAYIRQMKNMSDYARSKGIELGGYSLLASRRINDEEDVINPVTGKTGGSIFGNSPCLESNWGKQYFDNLQNFIDKTGFSLLEHDGNYPGDPCASVTHPGHKGLADSQWNQWKEITDFYKWCRSKDVYLNVPDWYYISGSNKTGIGYRETNWSLPRDRQVMLGRQNLFDGTWEKTPSMGWTFVPLVEYQGGGALATLEPLKDHLPSYEAHLAQNFGAGVQACYRGFRLYDSDETRQLVVKWVSWYKKYRLILNSDIIHLRRADGRDWDGFLHVNPELQQKGMLMLFNPLNQPIEHNIRIPLYYTGIDSNAKISESGENPILYKLNEKKEVLLRVNIPANKFIWFEIE
ncbi:MAG: alpha-galactosidase [Bacteroidales bacterium]|nr:alpha-galactosidase [Bacteroidales bacterium]